MCFSRIVMSGGCFPCAYRSRKIRLKSKWNTSCRVVPPYPKGQERLLEHFKWKLNLLVHFVYLWLWFRLSRVLFDARNSCMEMRHYDGRLSRTAFLCTRTINKERKRRFLIWKTYQENEGNTATNKRKEKSVCPKGFLPTLTWTTYVCFSNTKLTSVHWKGL